MIIEIPIEILDVTFRVEKEDPLKPLMDVISSVKIVDSNSQSIHRLDAISRSPSSRSNNSEYTTLKLCEIYGKESIGIYEKKNLSLEGNFTGRSINRLKPIEKIRRCEQIRRPSQGTGIPVFRDGLSGGVRR